MNWFFELETQYKITLIGVFATAIMSAISLYFSVRNNRAVHYVNSVTKSRAEWIQELRNLISDFIAIVSTRENKVFIHGDDEIIAYNEKLDKYSTKIKLLLNYTGKLDKKIIEDVEYIKGLSCDLYSYLYLVEELLDENLSVKQKDEIITSSEVGKKYLCDFIISCGHEIKKSEKFDLLEGWRIKNLIKEMRERGEIADDSDWVAGVSLQVIEIKELIEKLVKKLTKEVHIYLKAEWNRVKYESQGKTYEKETQEFDIWELEQKYDNPDYKNNVWKRFCINSKAKIRRIYNSAEFAVIIFLVGIVVLIIIA